MKPRAPDRGMSSREFRRIQRPCAGGRAKSRIKHQATWPTRVWHLVGYDVGYDHKHVWLGWLAPLVMLLAAFPSVDASKAKALELLANGLTPDEYPRALELSLRLQAGLTEKVPGSPRAGWLFALASTLILFTILSFCPKSVLGLGALAKRRLELERQKARIGTASMPGFIAASILGPYIWEALRAFF